MSTALAGWCGLASADAPPAIDVHVDVTVLPQPDTTAIEHEAAVRAARAEPKPHWLQLAIADVPSPDTISGHDSGGAALHARFEVDRGLITVSKENLPVYWIVGVEAARASTTTLDGSSMFNAIVANDLQAMMYGGVAVGSSRFEMQSIAGAGIERSTGTVYSDLGDMSMLSTVGPVVELQEVLRLRLYGPVSLIGGAGLVAHLARYRAYDGESFMREPELEVFAGLAVATY